MKIFLALLITLFFGAVNATAQLPSSNYLHGYQGNMLPGLAVTIAASSTTSGPIYQGGLTLVGCIFPAAMTGTSITFLASADGVTYVPVYNSSGQVSYTIAANRYIAIAPADLQGIKYLEIVSGSTEASTRNLICSLKGF